MIFFITFYTLFFQSINKDLNTGHDLKITLGAWAPRIGGDVQSKFGGVSIDETLGVDGAKTLFRPEIDFKLSKKWNLFLTGASFSSARSLNSNTAFQLNSLGVSSSDLISSQIQHSFFETKFLYGPIGLLNKTDQHGVGLFISPTVGFRFLETDIRVSSLLDSFKQGGSWLNCSVGGLLSLQIEQSGHFFKATPARWSLVSGGDIGLAIGEGGGSVWSVQSGIRLMFNEKWDIFFGYRLLEPTLKKKNFKITPGLQGLYLGGSFVF